VSGGPVLRCGQAALQLAQPAVMGILNVTPDSFWDGGRFAAADAAVDHALRMVEEGAAIIDVGGESTRPGSQAVSVEQELERVLPVIERLRARSPVVISVDTSKPEVMQRAAAAGAGIINDVRALTAPGALEAAARSGCAVCLMHMQGEPRTMQDHPVYADVVREVGTFLEARVAACRAAGFAAERLVVDPGFGFGKTLAHNLELLRRLSEIVSIGPPVLLGMSRKSSLAALLGRSPGERLPGSLALAALGVFNGARIIRAHDVSATLDAVRVAAAVRTAA
jgi:dihydropteroate synthase